jgi:hypothetical protein
MKGLLVKIGLWLATLGGWVATMPAGGWVLDIPPELYEKAVALVEEAEKKFPAHISEEFKRKQVYSSLIDLFPTLNSSTLSLASALAKYYVDRS